MKFKILIDMNLSPRWVEFLEKHTLVAAHWSTIGDHKAKDETIMRWAKEHQYIVFTNDLDFGTLLALTRAGFPSVIQMRTQNVLPEYWGKEIVSTINEYASQLEKGALIVLDDTKSRVRILPLN
jgi:predicted nuclease of predicted toxin-antitoxin system